MIRCRISERTVLHPTIWGLQWQMATNEEHCFECMMFFSHKHEPLLLEVGIRLQFGGHMVHHQQYIPNSDSWNHIHQTNIIGLKDLISTIITLIINKSYLQIMTCVLATVWIIWYLFVKNLEKIYCAVWPYIALKSNIK